MKKILDYLIVLAAISPIVLVVLGIISYQVSQKSFELEIKKFKEGQIPKKQLQIVNYGGTDVVRLLKSFTGSDTSFNINMFGEKLKNLYSINYHIENTGEAPILQSDFLENLTLMFPERYKILAINNSYTVPPEYHPVWKRISNHEIQLKPILINPGDKFDLNVYLSDIEMEKLKSDEIQDMLRGKWTVRIPNLSKIDIQDPITRKLQPPFKPLDFLLKASPLEPSNMTLYLFLTAGYVINAYQWGVYAILVLAAVMIFVYLNLLHPLYVYFHFNKQSAIFCIVIVSVFCFVASESYITFFAQLGRGVFWINYIFMLLYVVSIIILFLINKKIKVTQASNG